MTPDEAIARVASRQRGRVTRAQLVAAGLSAKQIAKRVDDGSLIREHRGVFAVAHQARIPLGAEQSALLACGARAVLSIGSAGVVWRLRSEQHPVHVTADGIRERPGIVVHHASLERHEVRIVEGLRVTSPARTLSDLAAVVSLPQLEHAVAEAHALGLVKPGDVEPRRGRRGADALRKALDSHPGITRSQAERLFLRLVRRAGLPTPQTNARVAGFEVDALWRSERLAVEIDGYASHGHRRSFERDRRKDRALRAAGLRTHRYTVRMLRDEPEAVLVDLVRGLHG